MVGQRAAMWRSPLAATPRPRSRGEGKAGMCVFVLRMFMLRDVV